MGLDGFEVEEIVDDLRGRVDSIPGAVKKIGDDGDTRVVVTVTSLARKGRGSCTQGGQGQEDRSKWVGGSD